MAPKQPNWPAAFRDIFLKLISTGQISVVVAGSCIIVLILKTLGEKIGEAWQTLHSMIIYHEGLGFGLSALFLISWFLHTRWQRSNAEREIRRLSAERTTSQQKFFKKKLESSDS